MNWEQILGLEKPGLKTVQYLGSVSLQELQNAVAAAELEVKELEAAVAGLKAKAATLKKNPFEGLLDTGDSLTKTELFSKLKALQRKKNALNAEKAKLGLDISKFKVKDTKKKEKVDRKATGRLRQNRYTSFMNRLASSERSYYKNTYDSETIIELEMVCEEGFSVEEAEQIVLYGNPAEIITDHWVEEDSIIEF